MVILHLTHLCVISKSVDDFNTLWYIMFRLIWTCCSCCNMPTNIYTVLVRNFPVFLVKGNLRKSSWPGNHIRWAAFWFWTPRQFIDFKWITQPVLKSAQQGLWLVKSQPDVMFNLFLTTQPDVMSVPYCTDTFYSVCFWQGKASYPTDSKTVRVKSTI